jgi:beta-glucosidase
MTDTLLTRNKKAEISIKVRNKGQKPGKEVVMMFIKDEVRSITPPMKELKAFTKIELQPGEEKEVRFQLEPQNDFGFPAADGKWLLEEGFFEIQVGKLKKQVFLKTEGKIDPSRKFKSMTYLQEEL